MYNSKFFQVLNTFADWFIHLVLLNILIITFALPVITLYPAISAGYNVLHDLYKNKDPRLFRDFFMYFKTNLIKKIVIGLTLFAIMLIGFINITYYSNQAEISGDWFSKIGYYITLTLLSVGYAVTIVTLAIVRVYPSIKIKMIFKLALVVSGKFYFSAVGIMIVNLLPFVLLFTPLTSLVFVFMGVSLPLLGTVFLTRRAVDYLENLGETND